MDSETAFPRPSPLERHAQIETDTFCEGCGYNLHGQRVSRDDRFGILICQCPECGRFHPAGKSTTATSVRGRRLATALLSLWVLIVLAVSGLFALGFTSTGFLHIDTLTYVHEFGENGGLIGGSLGGRYSVYSAYYRLNVRSSLPRADYNVHRRVRTTVSPLSLASLGLDESMRQAVQAAEEQYIAKQIRWLLLADAALGLGAGLLLTVFLWHWSRRACKLYLLVPIASALVATAIGLFNVTPMVYRSLSTWVLAWCLLHGVVQSAFVALGVWIGRPLARRLLRLALPPRPRQLFNFLWLVDGKVPPSSLPAA